jgi:hypothetical protein
VGISTYVLGVVGALTVASCVALGIGLALTRRGRPRRISGHTPGGRVLSPTASSGVWSAPYARVGTPGNAARPDEREGHRRRPLTADQQATRDAWARWRAEQGRQPR